MNLVIFFYKKIAVENRIKIGYDSQLADNRGAEMGAEIQIQHQSRRLRSSLASNLTRPLLVRPTLSLSTPCSIFGEPSTPSRQCDDGSSVGRRAPSTRIHLIQTLLGGSPRPLTRRARRYLTVLSRFITQRTA